MPYITKDRRPELDGLVYHLYHGFLFDWELSCILYKYAESITPSYNNYKNYCGELRQCANEIERRFKFKSNRLYVYDPSRIRHVICHHKTKCMEEYNLKINGDLNYVLFALYKRYFISTRYSENFNRSCGIRFCVELRHAAKQVEKYILAPYEDGKIVENGDVD